MNVEQKKSKTRKWYRQSPRQVACKQYVISVEENIYDNFREYAFQNGHSINSMVGELIKKALRSEDRARKKTNKRESLAHTGSREQPSELDSNKQSKKKPQPAGTS